MERLSNFASRTEPWTVKEVLYSVIGPLLTGAIFLGILLGTDGDCEYPIRLWLWIEFGVTVGLPAFTLIVIFIAIRVKDNQESLKKVGHCNATVRSLVALFLIVWFVFGNVWLYGSDDCSGDWLAGYVWTLIILIIWYIAILSICCFCCCACFGIGVAGAVLAAANQQSDGPMEQAPLVEDKPPSNG